MFYVVALQYGRADIYVRVVHQARASAESLAQLSPGVISTYRNLADVSRSSACSALHL